MECGGVKGLRRGETGMGGGYCKKEGLFKRESGGV